VAFEDSSGKLWVVGADGKRLRVLARDLVVTSYVGGNFSWAPDGRRIVFARMDGLFTVTTQGTPILRRINYRPIPDAPVALQPTWSPDGTRIAFSDIPAASARDGVPDSIVVMQADGSHVQVLQHGHDPVWSPDGAWIAGRTSGTDQCCSGYILLMHADGTQPKTWEAGGETFSPDSRRLAYGGFNTNNLYVANADGSHPVRVLHAPYRAFTGPPLWRGGTGGRRRRHFDQARGG
jgi:Tol biopolymer transport system component